MPGWPALPYEEWSATCDTVHGHAQVLGRIAEALAPPEPNYQHLALRLTVRGWESRPLPAPDGSGALGLTLDLHAHDVVVLHSDGRAQRVALVPDRSVAAVAGDVLGAARALGGPVEIKTKPHAPWTTPLDEDEEHATYDPGQVEVYLEAATRAAQVLAELRAPYPGHATPVNAWWGSFDASVSFFPNQTLVEEVAVGWWPGDERYPRAAFYAYARPSPPGLEQAALSPAAARWDATLGEFLLDWDDVRATADPHETALAFGRSALERALAG